MTAFFFTVTLHAVDLPLSFDVAVITAVPGLSAVTTPFSSTAAISGALLVQMSALS